MSRPLEHGFAEPRHYWPKELGALDLEIADPRIVWAENAKASSEYSSSYAASTACGPPSIFPRGGDRAGTWLARRKDPDPWIELSFPEIEGSVAGILVCETCGPGAVREIRDATSDEVLYATAPRVLRKPRAARLLYVPLELSRAPKKLRMHVAPYSVGDEYHQIDAIALITVSLDALLADPPSLGPVRHRRYAPDEVAALELHHDSRFVWAIDARASSEYSSIHRAHEAVGPPTVFPRSGDYGTTWLSENDDRDAWLELDFPPCERASGFIALETCGAGSIYKATDEHGEVLWEAKREKIRGRKARLLYVPLERTPKKLRLWVAAAEKDYREIDAVALVTAPIETLLADPPLRPTYRRYAPEEVSRIDLRSDPRIVWASRARASSQWSHDYAARWAVGRPRVFPRGGDIARTWLASSDDRRAWLELEFPRCEPVHGFIVLETCGAGAICRATDEHGEVLWGGAPEPNEERKARLLHVALDRAPSKLRLWLSNAVKDYREIDAVALITAPFEELFAPPPPPPPPPTPGAPEGGFSTLAGTLLGARESPFVHATLRTPTEGRAVNSGGPLRLRLDSGEEVDLGTGRTILYGAPLVRARVSSWRELEREVPWLAAALAGARPPEDSDLLVEARHLDDEARVEIAGNPLEVRASGGFRTAAQKVPTRFEVAAISVGPLADTTFPAHGVRDFDSRARPIIEPAVQRRHPLRAWALWTGAAAIASLITASGLAFPASETSLGTPLLGFALLLAVSMSAMALELLARTSWIPDFFLRALDTRRTDERVAFTKPGWLLTYTVMTVVFAGIPLGAALVTWRGEELLMLRLPLALGAVNALIRLVSLSRAQLPPLLTALRVALAPRARIAPGARGLLTGFIEAGLTFRRTESFTLRSEHLGTETVEDSQGNMVTRERYNTWYERRASASGPARIRLVLADGRVVSAPAQVQTTDVGMAYEGPGDGYARFIGQHGEGDEATLLGTIASVDGGITMEATHLVLGDLSTLRRRAAVQLGALVALAILVAVGAAAALC